MIEIVGFVPAKGNSTRVPEKNKQEVLGVPLYLWAANNLARVLDRHNIFVDSDCEEILDRARAHGFGAIKRPARLATNATDGNELMNWQASQVSAEIYVQHLPPMIFLKAETLVDAIKSVTSGAASCFAVFKAFQYLWKNQEEPAYDIDRIPNSVSLTPSIAEGMGLYVTQRGALASSNRRVAYPWDMVELDQFERIDIDTPEELEFARTVARGLGLDSPYTKGIEALQVESLAIDSNG